MQITIDNCVEVEQIATDLLLEDVQLNIGECCEKLIEEHSDKRTTYFLRPVLIHT